MGSRESTAASFDGRVLREQDGGYVVRVRDNAGNEHRVLVSPMGEIRDHGCDQLAGTEFDTLSETERDVIEQVYNHARFRVDSETDHQVVQPSWRPSTLASVAQLIETCSDETFDQFRSYYQELQQPSIKYERSNVYTILQPVIVSDDRERIDDVGSLWYNVQTGPQAYDWIAPDRPSDSLGDVETPFLAQLPLYTFEWGFEEKFREFLAHHFRCQVRDAYINRGEVPPPKYQLTGFGKIDFAGSSLTPDQET